MKRYKCNDCGFTVSMRVHHLEMFHDELETKAFRAIEDPLEIERLLSKKFTETDEKSSFDTKEYKDVFSSLGNCLKM